jgi:triosephosphate isomerase
MRKKIVAGNWKMNKTLEEGVALVSEIVNMVRDEVRGEAEIIIFPPFIHLQPLQNLLKGSRIATGGQNCHQESKGAFTGEISAEMLRSVGAGFVLAGHSERRQYSGETEKLLAAKVDAAIAAGLTPIYCCGETLDERNASKHFEVIERQVKDGLFHLQAAAVAKLVIAYEPVWAIGTGVNASNEQAQEIHAFIRGLLEKKYGRETASATRILYGGSVKPDNAAELFACADIDGGLIGGASLSSRSFTDIIKACS